MYYLYCLRNKLTAIQQDYKCRFFFFGYYAKNKFAYTRFEFQQIIGRRIDPDFAFACGAHLGEYTLCQLPDGTHDP